MSVSKKGKPVKTAKSKKTVVKKERHDYGLLSKKELEVMQMIVKGAHHKQIEEKMNIAYETFKTHRKNLLRKLKLKNIVQLTHLVMQENLTRKVPATSSIIFIEMNDGQRRKLSTLANKKNLTLKKYCEGQLTKHLKEV